MIIYNQLCLLQQNTQNTTMKDIRCKNETLLSCQDTGKHVLESMASTAAALNSVLTACKHARIDNANILMLNRCNMYNDHHLTLAC